MIRGFVPAQISSDWERLLMGPFDSDVELPDAIEDYQNQADEGTHRESSGMMIVQVWYCDYNTPRQVQALLSSCYSDLRVDIALSYPYILS